MDFISTLKNQLLGDNVGKAAVYLGESESGITKAISGLFPAILGTIFSKASTQDGASAMLKAAKDAHKSGIAGNVMALFSGDASTVSQGGNLSQGLLGNNSNTIATAISSFAGIKSSSVTSLMGMIAPVVMGSVGKHAEARHLDATGFMDFARQNASGVQAMLPSGLANMATQFGLGSLPSIGNLSGTSTSASSSPTDTVKWMPIFLGVTGACLIIGLLWYFMQTKHSSTGVAIVTPAIEEPAAPVTTPVVSEPAAAVSTGHLDEKSGNFIYDSGNVTEFKLPDGTVIKAGETSSESKLFKMLNDASWTISEDKSKGWITLESVYFETGSSKLTTESQAQLQNIAGILKAFQTAELKMGGYTDNQGDSTKNVSLSQKRAEAAMAELVKLGTGKTRLKAEGYGPTHPVATNETNEGRAQNRRVDVRVTKK